jgi:hypothetical protein
MKDLNIAAALLVAFAGVGATFFGFVDNEPMTIGAGIGLLIFALVFATFSKALELLEAIRDELRHGQSSREITS